MASEHEMRLHPDKRRIAILVYLMGCLQVTGFGIASMKALRSSAVPEVLVGYGFLSAGPAELFNQFYFGLMVAALIVAFFRYSPWPFYGLGLLFLGDALARTVLEGGLHAPFAFAGDASRFLWFLAIGYALRNARTMDVEIGLPRVRILLRFGLAMTFISQGMDALLWVPSAAAKSSSAGLLEVLTTIPLFLRHSSQFSIALGLIGLTIGFMALYRPGRTILGLTTLWGFILAASPILIAPYEGTVVFLLKTPYYMLPLLILVIEGQRSFRQPLRKAYSRTLRKIGISLPHRAWKRSSQDG